MEDIFRRQLFEAGTEILEAIGTAASTQFIAGGGGAPQPDRLTSRSGQLVGALQNKANRSITFDTDAAHFRMGFPEGLARIYVMHEDGGQRPVTERMRSYFWFRYFQNDGMYPRDMWSYLARKGTVLTYPRRSFMQDAFRSQLTNASQIIRRYVGIALDLTIKRIIAEVKK